MRIRYFPPLVLALLCSTPALPAVLSQVTDDLQIAFSAASLDDAGAFAFAGTTADIGGSNPEHRWEAARWSTSTGVASLLTTFPAGVRVRRFAASDDGQWLLLESTSDPVGTNPSKASQLFLYRTDGLETRQLTFAAAGEPPMSAWALSGSANRVVFATRADLTGGNPSGKPQIFVVDADGTDLLQLTANATDAGFDLSISDDGERIAFGHSGNLTGGNADLSPELFAILADGTDLRQLTSTAGSLGGVWRPMVSGNGAKIVFDSAENIAGQNTFAVAQIWSMNWDGTGRTRLTSNTTANFGSATEASVADDGVWVVFAQERITAGNPDGNVEIWKVMTNATGEAQLTSTTATGNRQPVISGDGSRIVFRAGGAIGGQNLDGGDALVAMDAAGGSLQLLLEGTAVAVNMADLSADGSAVFFIGTTNALGTNPERREQVFRVEADGTGLDQLTAFDDQTWLWNPSVSSGGEWVVFGSNGDPLGQNPPPRQGEIFAVRGDGTDLRQLTPSSSGQGPFQGPPAIAGNGSWVVFQSTDDYTGGNPDFSAELFRVAPDGTGMLQLTSDDSSTYKLPRVDGTGTWVAYQEFSGSKWQVFRVRTDGTGFQQLTNDPTFSATEPDISDAGDRIAYSSAADPLGTNPEHNAEIFTLDPGTMTFRQLTETTTGTSDRPRISGDGAWVSFLSDVPFFGPNPFGGYEVYRVRVSDGLVERLSGVGAAFVGSTWRYRDLAATNQDGAKTVFAASTDLVGRNPDGSGEVFLADQNLLPMIHVGKSAPTVVSWDAEPGAVSYDLIRGDVAALAAGGGTVDLGAVTCVENDSTDLDNVESEDAVQPGPGQVFFFLLRGTQGPLDGPGSYGQGTGGLERVATAGDCPG